MYFLINLECRIILLIYILFLFYFRWLYYLIYTISFHFYIFIHQNLKIADKCNENNKSWSDNRNPSYKRVDLQETMRKGVDSDKELREGAMLYYLASQFSIEMPYRARAGSIFNEKNVFNFTVEDYEVFQVLFK